MEQSEAEAEEEHDDAGGCALGEATPAALSGGAEQWGRGRSRRPEGSARRRRWAVWIGGEEEVKRTVSAE